MGVFRLIGQPKRDSGMIFRSCKASQSPVYPIRDAILAGNHASCPSLSPSAPRQWGESAIKIEFLAIVHGAAVVDFCSVVVIGIRAPEEDVDMGTEVDMGVGVDVGLGVGAGRREIHDQQEGQE